MISLEQVHALEARVEKAVSYIASLRSENAQLRDRLEEDKSFIDEAAVELEAAESARDAAQTRVAELESRLAEAEAKTAELAGRIDEYRRDQSRIEEGIVHALEKLDSFEDLVLGQTPVRSEPPDREAVASQPASKADAPAAPVGPAPQEESQAAEGGEKTEDEAQLDIF